MRAGETWWRRVAAAVVTALGLIGMAWMSDAPIPVPGADSAGLRLSWSARPQRIERCREVSAEELEKLGEHMRQRVECEGRFATYLLRVTVDGSVAHQSVVTGAGLRNDRPIYLLEDFDVVPGPHRVAVSFARRESADDDGDNEDELDDERARADTGLSIGRADRERVERARRARAAIPPRLELDTALIFSRGNVIVVTLDPERGALQVLASAPPSR